MVGFNRRFAPQVREDQGAAGAVHGAEDLHHDRQRRRHPGRTTGPRTRDVGGGRLIGEACHFIDLLRFLAGSPIPPSSHAAWAMRAGKAITRRHGHHHAGVRRRLVRHHPLPGQRRGEPSPRNGSRCLRPAACCRLDNFRSLKGYGWPGFGSPEAWRQDKGQNACVASFLASWREGLRTDPAGPNPGSGAQDHRGGRADPVRRRCAHGLTCRSFRKSAATGKPCAICDRLKYGGASPIAGTRLACHRQRPHHRAHRKANGQHLPAESPA